MEAEYSSIVTYPEATSTVNDELRVHESNSMTVKTSCLAINKFFHKHHLSKKAQEDLLILMQQLLPQPNNLPVTLYYFQKQTDFDTDTFHLQYYCPRCYSLGDKDTLCSNQSCKGAIGDCHFILLSLCTQLQRIFNSKLHAHSYTHAFKKFSGLLIMHH